MASLPRCLLTTRRVRESKSERLNLWGGDRFSLRVDLPLDPFLWSSVSYADPVELKPVREIFVQATGTYQTEGDSIFF